MGVYIGKDERLIRSELEESGMGRMKVCCWLEYGNSEDHIVSAFASDAPLFDSYTGLLVKVHSAALLDGRLYAE